MAQALVAGLISGGYLADNILIAEPDARRREYLSSTLAGVQINADNADVAARADCIVLAVKPQVMRAVCVDLAKSVKNSKPLIVSIAAGTNSRDIDEWMGGNNAVVRAMPNQPALLGMGVTGFFANEQTSSEQIEHAAKILSAVGNVVRVSSEEDIDAVTAISGSGPAYFYVLIEALVRAAQELGLPAEAAQTLVLDTARGATALASESGETMQTMIERVRSPGGTTEAALAILDNENVRDIFARATTAARDRAVVLAESSSQ